MKLGGWIAGLALLSLVACVSGSKPREPEVTGGYDKEFIRMGIRDHLIPFRHCYEKELKTRPGLSGKAVVEWDILEKGQVGRVAMVQSFDPAIDGCLMSVIGKIKFTAPRSNDIVRVRYPFTFNATESGPEGSGGK